MTHEEQKVKKKLLAADENGMTNHAITAMPHIKLIIIDDMTADEELTRGKGQ